MTVTDKAGHTCVLKDVAALDIIFPFLFFLSRHKLTPRPVLSSALTEP
jgi:hypothetical protein